MDILIMICVCFFAGMGAGLGTGLAGLSAAAVVSPMLITFIWARIGAKWANKASAKRMNQVTGVVLTVLGVMMLLM